MIPFDHSKIALGIYKAKAVALGGQVEEILQKGKIVYLPYLEGARIYGRNEYAASTYRFLHKIASRTLLPNTPQKKIKEIVDSDGFNISVMVRAMNDYSDRRKEPAYLTLKANKSMDELSSLLPDEDFIGLGKDTFESKKISPLETLRVYIDPEDVIFWNNYEKNTKLGNLISDAIENMRRPGFEPGF